ncbi:MAG: ABC transporter permease [Oscillospiraceae bacterium]
MFFHIFKYTVLTNIRNKAGMFWLLAFPIILGTFFNIAFSSIFEKSEKFSAIDVAVVTSEKNEIFDSTLKQVSEGEDRLFTVKRTDEKKALEMLENDDVSGVIYENGELSLTVKEEGVKSTIIKYFLDRYKINEAIIIDTVKTDPTKLESVTAAMSKEIHSFENESSESTNDNFIQYFYNLMAMAALYCSLSGLSIMTGIQGNLSDIGARRCVSPVSRLTTITASLFAIGLVSIIVNMAALAYFILVLKVDFGDNIPAIIGITAMGSLLGTSLGFFVGSIGKGSEGVKTGITLAVTMFCCFCSGLMVGTMKQVVEKFAPWFNRINPAVLISQSYCALNIYSTNDRLYSYLITMAVMTAVLTLLGFLMTRRQKYASL